MRHFAGIPKLSKSIVQLSVLLAGWASLSTCAWAEEVAPEFHTFPSWRGFQLIDPRIINSEYQSDIEAYGESPLRRSWLNTRNYFAVSAGSLSATQFDSRLQAQLVTELSDRFEFRFHRLENENYEELLRASLIELAYRLDREWWISSYGSLERFKKEDDVGFALIWRQHDAFASSESSGSHPRANSQRVPLAREFRLFATQVDFTRSERSDSGDTFTKGKAPWSFGYVYRTPNLQTYLRRESKTEWVSPAEDRRLTYEKTAWGYTHRDADRTRVLRLFADQLTQSLTTISTQATRSFQRDRVEAEYRRRYELDVMGLDDSQLEFGLSWVHRSWKNELNSRMLHQQTSPLISWLQHGDEPGWEVGYGGTWFRAFEDLSLGATDLKPAAWESRLNVRRHIDFKTRGRLELALTFDVDGGGEFGTFEGGHGQFVVEF